MPRKKKRKPTKRRPEKHRRNKPRARTFYAIKGEPIDVRERRLVREILERFHKSKSKRLTNQEARWLYYLIRQRIHRRLVALGIWKGTKSGQVRWRPGKRPLSASFARMYKREPRKPSPST